MSQRALSPGQNVTVPGRELGKRLEARRERERWSHEEAAAYFGVAQSTYTRWENGHFFPERGPKLNRMAAWLGVTVEDIQRLKHPETGEPITTAEVIVQLHELRLERERDRAALVRLEQTLAQQSRQVQDLMDAVARALQQRSPVNGGEGQPSGN